MDKKKLILIISTIVLLIILLIIFVSCSSSTKSINIIFDSNGGSEILNQVINEGELVEEPIAPIRTNFDFIYWELNENEFHFNTKLYEDTTLIAKWEVKDDVIIEEYTITYYLDGGVNHLSNPETITNVSSRFRLNDATKEGYTFEGWYSESTFINKITVLQNVENNIELYAKWILIENDTLEEYTITYYLNGGTNDSSNPLKCTKEDVITLKNATRSGYIFEGWYTESSFINKITILQNIENNIELHAKWNLIEDELITNFTITYYLDGGINDSNNPLECTRDDYIELFDATKEEFIFGGWYTESTFINKITILETVNKNLELYAKWIERGDEYTITYTLYDGINNPDNPSSFFNGETIHLQEATKDGYVFSGWYSNRVGGTKIEVIDISYNSNVTLFARWTLAVYDISYDLFGGVNSENNLSIYTIETEFTLEVPTRLNDEFKGWNVNGVFYETFTLNKTTGNLTIEAVWIAYDYKINYELNGGTNDISNPLTYSADDGTVELYQPQKTNYDLGYWSLTDDGLIELPYLTYDILLELNGLTIVLYAFYIENDIDLKITEGKDHYDNDCYYLEYGSYPQSVETSTVIINALNKLTSTNDNGYYEYNGNEYAKEVSNFIGTNSSTYTWNNGNVAYTNTIYYFKVEPIKWRVLQNDSVIQVISEYILDSCMYYSLDDDREIEGKTIYKNNYKHSDLRYFLNNTFYNKAFNDDEKFFITTIEVDNRAKTTAYDWNTYYSENTYDKIYSLSYEDLTNTSYGFSTDYGYDRYRTALLSDYAFIKKGTLLTGFGMNLGMYWTRSPYAYTNEHVTTVAESSTLTYGIPTNSIYTGIRPVFSFK